MIGYKGFDKNLRCLNYQFEIGKEFTEKEVYLCRSGFHFCAKLTNVFSYYSNKKDNRFCLVEASGTILHENRNEKSAAQTLKIIRELSKEEINSIIKKELQDINDDVFCINMIYDLQQKYNFMIGGSISLHLYGHTLERKNNKPVDLDIIMPYYQKMLQDDKYEIEEFDGKSSGNDFSSTLIIYDNSTGKSVKADLRIDPHKKYEIIDYKDRKYKVCDIMTTLEAKCRYAMEGNSKHRDDVLFLINNK